MFNSHESRAGTGRAPFRLLVPFFFAGLFVAGTALVITRAVPRAALASEVRQEMIDVVQSNGWVGAFRVGAGSFDAATDTFLDFHAETDDLLVGARTAELEVNPATNTVSFTLSRAMIIRLVDENDGADSPYVSKDRYVLGPFPYKRDIVEDDQPRNLIPRDDVPPLVDAERNH